MFRHHLEDHGLPLVQLKEQRRDLIVALMGRTGRITKRQIAEIAAIQQAIAAVEAVVVDLDTELIASMLSERRSAGPCSRVKSRFYPVAIPWFFVPLGRGDVQRFDEPLARDDGAEK